MDDLTQVAGEVLAKDGRGEPTRDALALVRASTTGDGEAVHAILAAYAGDGAPLIEALTAVAVVGLYGWCDGDRAVIAARLDEMTAASVAAAATTE